jgi:hypothetical protein
VMMPLRHEPILQAATNQVPTKWWQLWDSHTFWINILDINTFTAIYDVNKVKLYRRWPMRENG